MKKEIIKTENYLLVVDDSEIKVGNWVYNQVSKEMYRFNENLVNYEKKVIAHLPINDSADLKGVPLLPPLDVEDDVDFICEEEAKKFHDKSKHRDDDMYNQLVYEDKLMIKIGYNKAKETYKFTEDDMKKLFAKTIENAPSIESHTRMISDKEYRHFVMDDLYANIIKSIVQPKTPTHFEFEIERKSVLNLGIEPFNPNTHFYTNEPKTTTDSQGQEVACGKYIY